MYTDPLVAEDRPDDLLQKIVGLEIQLSRYRAALAGGHVGVWETDLETGTLAWDPATFDLLGLTPATYPATRDEFHALVHPDDRERLNRAVQSAVGGDGRYAAEFRVPQPDGTDRWLASVGRVTREPDGRAVRLIGVITDVTVRHQVEDRLRASLREKEALLKEVHHRVKNNLQVVSSLLYLQSTQLADPAAKSALRDSQTRVRSMALVHEGIYRSADFGRIDLAHHLDALVTQLFRAHGTDPGRVRPVLQVPPADIDLDRAVTCSLLVHELVANALKHAFPDGRAGTVTVSVEPTPPGWYTLTVADDGVGLPPGLDVRKTTTLGLQLVCSLTQQLGGTIAVDPAAGAEFRLAFPAPRPSPGSP